MQNILFVLMEDFRDEEFLLPYEIIKNAGYNISIAGLTKDPKIKGSQGHKQSSNLNFYDMKNEDFDKYSAIIIPGGPGSKKYLWSNEKLQDAIKYFYENKKIVAAICYAVIAIVETGILLHKHATVFPTDESKKIFEDYGVKFSSDPSVSLPLENIITAQGPQEAEKFGQEIVNLLNNKNNKNKLGT